MGYCFAIEPENPGETIKEYLVNLYSGNYERAYSYLSSDDKKYQPKEEYVKMQRTMVGMLKLTGQAFKIKKIEILGTKAKAFVDEPYPSSIQLEEGFGKDMLESAESKKEAENKFKNAFKKYSKIEIIHKENIYNLIKEDNKWKIFLNNREKIGIILEGATDSEREKIQDYETISYSSPIWLYDSQKIAYIKEISYWRYDKTVFSRYTELPANLIRTVFQIIIKDLVAQKENIIQTFTIFPKSDLHRVWYEWANKEYEGIQRVEGIVFDTKTGLFAIICVPWDKLLSYTLGKTIFIMDKNGDNLEKVIDATENINDVFWHPKTSELVLYKMVRKQNDFTLINKSIWLMDVIHKRRRLFLDNSNNISFSSDGRKAFYYKEYTTKEMHGLRDLVIMDLEKNRSYDLPLVEDIVWSPNNDKVICRTVKPIFGNKHERYSYSLVVKEFAGDNLIERHIIYDIQSGIWNPEGTKIVYYSNYNVYLFDLNNEKSEILFKAHYEYPIRWLKNNKLLVKSSNGYYIWDLNSSSKVFDKKTDYFNLISYSPDEKYLLTKFGDGKRIGIMNIDTLDINIILENHEFKH